MDVNFEKRLLRPANANIISPNGLSRASRNLFGRSPVEAGSSQYSLRSPTRNVSPSISVSKTDIHDMLLECNILLKLFWIIIIFINSIYSLRCIERALAIGDHHLDHH